LRVFARRKDQEGAYCLYNPQQNGVVEKKNRSIIGVVKAMIHDQDLPMFLWVEACNTTIYIHNKCPHRILEEKTPEEAFTGVKPEVSHFHIFGCPVYIHVHVEKRTKMEPSSRKVCLWVTVRLQRPTKSSFYIRGI
jgi:hypothetical protein